ncbi:MAG: hypothetical protein GKR87_15525 [Kiritimatiellae bacterium]|nr:hypothetical protein [Kiritimatiellia bacterium]
MNASKTVQPGIKHAANISLRIGIAGLAGTLLGAMGNMSQFYQSYLQAYIFWSGISIGSLAALMIHHLAGGGWGFVTQRILEASVKTLPLVALLFIPIILGMDKLYHHWLHPEAIHVALIELKSLYLNKNAFIIRTVIYFVIWIGMGTWLCKWSTKQDETGDKTLNRPMRKLSGIGIVIYGLTATAASWDWTMSLEPTWFSSIWGPLFMVGQGLSTFAFSIIVLSKLAKHNPLAKVIKSAHFHDLGNLTFAFVILWTYMTFGQFIIIWSGNLPEEIIWYLDRTPTGWKVVAILLTVFHFLLPFLLLLSRLTKLKAQYLAKIALFVLLIRLVDNFWVIAPTFQDGVNIHLLDFTTPLAIGGLWMFVFLKFLPKHSLIPLHDPRFKVEEDPHD